MGRVRTVLIKRTGHELMKAHGDEFSNNFEENKLAVDRLLSISSKMLRNKIAGYVTDLVNKRKKKTKEDEYYNAI